MPVTPSAWVVSEGFAGLQSQPLGLAEAAGLAPETMVLRPRAPWRFVPARLWPQVVARHAAGTLPRPLPDVLIGCGGVAAAVNAASRPRSPAKTALVHVQHPRMDVGRFDVIVVAAHDDLTGPNVVVTRTALHRVTPTRLAAASAVWAPRLAHLTRPLVAVLVGGSNGRFELGEREAGNLANQLAVMMRADKVGVALTASRRTGPAAQQILRTTLEPFGGWMWDGQGENPYFGLLAMADAIIVTMDSVSMVSEAVATSAPVMIASLPGKSRRIGTFLTGLRQTGRVRGFGGHAELWPVAPLDDTAAAAYEMRRRLGF